MLSSCQGLGLPGGVGCAQIRRAIHCCPCFRSRAVASHGCTAWTTSRIKSTCPMGSSRKALRAAEARRFSSAPSLMARSGAATYARARAQCSRMARWDGVSVGIAYEAARNRLWVAGGGPGFNAGIGDVRVYDASSGELLATFVSRPATVGAPQRRGDHTRCGLRDGLIQRAACKDPAAGGRVAAIDRLRDAAAGHRRPSSRPPEWPTSMGSSPRAACSSWRSRTRGSSSASTRPPGRPTKSILATAWPWAVSTAWSCKGARSTRCATPTW